ncbi:MAG: cellulase family glycosylhydrolase [Desulfobacterales bacterium]|nr:cellulase family glycosylhydrolase [Desulfobacterales bacterium]
MSEQANRILSIRRTSDLLKEYDADVRLIVFVRSVLLVLAGNLLFACVAQSADEVRPIELHPENPHYFLWRGKPTVLITSAEHYGAVLNRAFDYKKYLKTLQSYGFNLTRTFSGAYCEPAGAFKIKNNTLAPAKGQLICPWARSQVPGYPNGGNKFDLTKWDPAYFNRLCNFVVEAGRRGIVVEVVMFCPFYDDSMWKLSPMNAVNNINGIGKLPRYDVYTLKDKKLTAVQDAMVRRIVQKLKDFDNVYYEICNEPYERSGQSEAWQTRIAEMIVKVEKRYPFKHLIAQNLPWRAQNLPKDVKNKVMPNPHVSVLNFHGASPPNPVALYYGLNKVIAYDETGRGSNKKHRTEGWDFIIAGGGVYDNLDLSFTVGHEDGTAKTNAPGGGGPVLHKQLKILKDFINSFDFIKMKPNNSVIKGKVPEKVTARALVQAGRAYAIYINGGSEAKLLVELPQGAYRAEWVNTKTGKVDKKEKFEHSGGNRTLHSPKYVDDIALRIRKLI